MTPAELTQSNPVEVSLYTPWDAARYLHIPVWTLLALTGRPGPEWFFAPFPWRFPYFLPHGEELALPANHSRISFHRFAELFVHVAAFQVLAEWAPTGERQRESWESLNHAIWRGLEDSHHKPVPFDNSPIEKRVDKLVKPYAQRLKDEPLALLRKWTRLRLERVEVRDDEPVRLYPFSREPAERSPRIIALDPRIRFGRPTIIERGVPTDSLFDRYQAGDSIAELAADYDLPAAEVEEAIRCESLPVAALFPFPGW